MLLAIEELKNQKGKAAFQFLVAPDYLGSNPRAYRTKIADRLDDLAKGLDLTRVGFSPVTGRILFSVEGDQGGIISFCKGLVDMLNRGDLVPIYPVPLPQS